MITKETARQFCAFFNSAEPGEWISVLPNGESVLRLDGNAWVSIQKQEGDRMEDTETAYDYLKFLFRQAITRLNNAVVRAEIDERRNNS